MRGHSALVLIIGRHRGRIRYFELRSEREQVTIAATSIALSRPNDSSPARSLGRPCRLRS